LKPLSHANVFVIRIILITVIAFTCYSPAFSQKTPGLDQQVLIEFTEHRSHEPTEFEQAISGSTNYISLSLPLTMLATGLIMHDNNTIDKSLYLAESIGVSTALTIALKYSINRKRPYEINPLIVKADKGGSPSFPSGHVSEAFSSATALAIAFPKWYVVAPAYLWATSVGYSRMYLGVHYPTDILAGAIAGSLSALLTCKANKWFQHKNTVAHANNPI
jgi:undecaprenyl-diphosphatase